MAKRARHLRHRRADADEPENQNSPTNQAVAQNAKTPAKPWDQMPHSDKSEGIIRDPVLWNGQVVSYVKDIGVYDADYDPDVRKVMLQPESGGRVVVPATEINKDNRPMVESARAVNRVPHLTFPFGHPDALPGEGR